VGAALDPGRSKSSPGGQNEPTHAVIDAPGSALAVQDRGPDTLVFKGSDADIGKLEGLLRQIDVPTPEVLVKAVVYEVASGADNRSAISIATSILGGKFGLTAGAATPGDYSTVFKSATLQMVYDALSTDARFKVVTSPTIRVRSGASARLLVGDQTPVMGASQLDKNGNVFQTVEYKPSGVILNITPEVRGDVSELQLNQQISNFVQTTTGVNTSPTLVTREVSTSVGIRGDEILVLGGLDQLKESAANRGLPFLPEFLRSRSDANTKSEILLILQVQRI
jgi:type II secretory pathway component GspD/PulD (secretin)